jgi:hypothetical protein
LARLPLNPNWLEILWAVSSVIFTFTGLGVRGNGWEGPDEDDSVELDEDGPELLGEDVPGLLEKIEQAPITTTIKTPIQENRVRRFRDMDYLLTKEYRIISGIIIPKKIIIISI